MNNDVSLVPILSCRWLYTHSSYNVCMLYRCIWLRKWVSSSPKKSSGQSNLLNLEFLRIWMVEIKLRQLRNHYFITPSFIMSFSSTSEYQGLGIIQGKGTIQFIEMQREFLNSKIYTIHNNLKSFHEFQFVFYEFVIFDF